TTGQGALKIAFIYDKQANSATFVPIQYNVVDNLASPRLLDSKDRFVTIAVYDKEWTSNLASPNAIWRIHDKRTFNLPIQFNATNGGTSADVLSGSIHMVTWNTGVATAAMAGSGYVRLFFMDE
ncbi:hypothetical protein HKBW3S44_01882, partial [Candidatus Hakubella thermalkaliphila]